MEIHLASMENITCWAFRKLCLPATDSYTGVLSLTNLIKRSNIWEEIDTFKIEGQKQWAQVATSKETECFSFIKKLEEEIKNHPEKDNVYGIQLNASCPSPNLIRIGQGPALIKRVTKVCNLVKELLKQDRFKVGIKLRLGLNEMEVRQGKVITLLGELEEIAKDNHNFTNVTIHFKHAQESSSAKYDYSMINEIASFNLPLVLNGGINNSEDAKKLMEMISPENRKNIKGVMIGREALRNPDCFSEIDSEINNSSNKNRTQKEISSEFQNLCKEHSPKPIYLSTIKERVNV